MVYRKIFKSFAKLCESQYQQVFAIIVKMYAYLKGKIPMQLHLFVEIMIRNLDPGNLGWIKPRRQSAKLPLRKYKT